MRKTERFRTYIIGFALLISTQSSAHDLTKINFDFLYNHDPVKITHQIAQQDSLYQLQLVFHLVKVLPSDKLEDFHVSQQKKINSAKEDVINPIAMTIDSGFVKNTINLSFYAQAESNYIVIDFTFLGKLYYYGISINQALAFPLPDFLVQTDAEAMFYHGFKASDSVWLEHMSNTDSSYFVYQYLDEFGAALPPMMEDAQPPNQSLNIQSITGINGGIKLPKANSLYYFQGDTSSTEGQSLIAHQTYYPRTKNMEELLEPLIYICTGDEYDELQAAEDKKIGFNEFWLDHIDDKKLASETIKKYFRSVKFANALFTDYKKGWKTDRGMIYIAFGPPEKVTLEEGEEIWEYSTFEGDLKFTFAKTPNLFVQHHYTLVRKKVLNKCVV